MQTEKISYIQIYNLNIDNNGKPQIAYLLRKQCLVLKVDCFSVLYYVSTTFS